MRHSSESVLFQPLDNSPQWFLDNIRRPGESIHTPVANRSVHILGWNWENTDLPTLMLVHGFGAHAHWWSFLAPFFIDRYRVVAIDLPGMGDSEPPAVYEENSFANAIIACIEQHQLQRTCIIGHSFGGAQSLRAIAMSPHLFSRGIIVDTNVRLPPEPPIRNLQPRGQHKPSTTQAECVSRFRLVPPQPTFNDAIIHYIAHHSCTGCDNVWHWKSDPNCVNVGEIEGPELLRAISARIDLIYGENSFLNINNKPARVLDQFPQPGELLTIPEAGHHIMVDFPLQLVSSINYLLSINP
jgi:pimeloyl-ACP methyl ester carboxylesterase